MTTDDRQPRRRATTVSTRAPTSSPARRAPGRPEARRPTDGRSTSTDLSVLLRRLPGRPRRHLDVHQHEITAFIGPSGCGKSTVLRCFNRMNDLIDVARVEGTIIYHGVDLYDPTSTRSRCAGGSGWCSRSRTRSRSRSTTTSPSARGSPGVEGRTSTRSSSRSLRGAALWDEVKDRLKAVGAWACPAASSSACASPGRSPSSPR